MDKARDKVVEKSARLVSVKDYESRLAAVLAKIREESLQKLKWYDNQFSTIKAVVDDFRREWFQVSTYELQPKKSKGEINAAMGALVRSIESLLKETPDDCSRHDLPGRYVDSSERSDGGTHGATDRFAGKPDGESI